VLWGLCVVTPEAYCVRPLDDLHQEHHGMCGMKPVARGHFWWPGLDSAIRERVSVCPVCVVMEESPPNVPLHPWKWPVKPWEAYRSIFLRRTS